MKSEKTIMRELWRYQGMQKQWPADSHYHYLYQGYIEAFLFILSKPSARGIKK